MQLQGAPDAWLVTLLIGILKRVKVISDLDSYSVVGLESCISKVDSFKRSIKEAR